MPTGVVCGAAPVIVDGYHNAASAASYSYGTVLVYTCFFGYYFGRLTDTESVTCTSSGQWDRVPRNCTRTSSRCYSLVSHVFVPRNVSRTSLRSVSFLLPKE